MIDFVPNIENDNDDDDAEKSIHAKTNSLLLLLLETIAVYRRLFNTDRETTGIVFFLSNSLNRG